MKYRRNLVSAGLAAALLSLAASTPAALAADRLPDLRMATIQHTQLDRTTLPGRKLLRFTSVIVNVGPGPLELRGSRPNTATPEMTVTQRIYNTSGGFRDVATDATMFFAGDGHNHWHTKDLESSDLVRLDNGAPAGALAKQGFCFADNQAFAPSLPGAPSARVYVTCGGNSSVLTQTMGLSVGWGDPYYWDTAFQWIDITGVPSGRYRILLTADASHWFQETDQTNNTTWADIVLGPKGVSVLSYGPAAVPDASAAPLWAPDAIPHGSGDHFDDPSTEKKLHKEKKHPK